MNGLRPRQLQAIADVRAAYAAGFRAPILRASTGFGKTHTSAEIIRSAVALGKTVWFTAHLQELLNDTAKRLHAAGIAHGYIAAGHSMNLNLPVQVVSAQTLMRRIDKINRHPDLLIVDEAHVGMDRTKAMQEALGHPLSLLLTATPVRLDGRGLSEIADTIVETCGTQELIDEGLLVPIRYFAPSNVDLSGVRSRMGDYAQDDLARAVDKPSIIGSAVAHYQRLAHGRPAVAFCVSLEHAEHTATEFRAAGYRVMVVSGNSTDGERRAALHGLTSGEIDVVCNCQLWVAGVDCPAISCIISLAPTQSLTKYLQSIGRGLRTHPGKQDCIILDHANLWRIHGLPTDDREWSLDGDRKRGKKRDPDDIDIRQCPKCYAILKNTIRCACGYLQPIQSRKVEQVDGELAEIDLEAQRRQFKSERASAQSLEALLELAKRTGKNPKWAYHVHRARQEKEAKRQEEFERMYG